MTGTQERTMGAQARLDKAREYMAQLASEIEDIVGTLEREKNDTTRRWLCCFSSRAMRLSMNSSNACTIALTS